MNKSKTIFYVLLTVLAAAYFYGSKPGDRKILHTFVFDNRTHRLNIETLTLAGDFNHWQKNGPPLTDTDGDSIWTVSVKLRPGWHYYRFVLNGQTWLRDWDNPQYGGPYSNSMVYVDTMSVPVLIALSPANGSWLYDKQDTLKLCFNQNLSRQSDLHLNFWLDGQKKRVLIKDSLVCVPWNPYVEGERRWQIELRKKSGARIYGKEGIVFVNLKNQPPVANAGYTQFAKLNDRVQLDGGMSFDPDMEPRLHFSWRQISGAFQVKLKQTTTPFPAFLTTRSGTYGFELTVRDSLGGQSRDTTQVVVLPEERKETLFQLHRSDFAQPVYKAALAGEFNQWNKDAARFIADSDSAVWRVSLPLPPGQYEYKFVLNDKDWVTDPQNPQKVPDGWNGYNSLRTVEEQEPPPLTLAARRPVSSRNNLKIALKTEGGTIHWFADVQNKGNRYRAGDTLLYFDTGNPQGIYFYYALPEKDGRFAKALPLMIRHFKRTSVSDFSQSPAWADTAIVYELFVRTFSASGDLQGVLKRLPYLQQLGVNTLWLMPVYDGPTGHGYAPTDLFFIEKDYGTLKDYRRLIAAAHKAGMKVIFDLVANHLSDQHRFVKAAADNLHSPLRDWFYWRPDGSWGYHNDWDTLVNLNYNNPSVRHYQLQAAAFWAAQGVDGFRCDVAWAVPHNFWKDFRRQVKKINRQILLIDEVLPRQPAYHDNEFDMSYDTDFYGTLIDVMSGRKPVSAFDYTLQKTKRNYPKSAKNLRYLENHDLERFLKQFGPAKTKIAAVILFTLPGTPLIYQGQEHGSLQMRPAFPLIQDRNWFDFYRSLIKLRKKHKAFTLGHMQTVTVVDSAGFWEFRRKYAGEEFHVLINLSGERKEVNISPGPSTVYYKEEGLFQEKGRNFIKPISFIIYKKG